MSKFVLLLLNVCWIASAHSWPKKSLAFQEEWDIWQLEHQKSYKHHHEEAKRHAIWLANRNAIEEHNSRADVHGFTLKMNHLGDLVRVYLYNYLGDKIVMCTFCVYLLCTMILTV